jgi:hypothetical protein
MSKLKASANLQPPSTLCSEVLGFIKYKGEEKVLVQYVSKAEVREHLIFAWQHPILVIGLPLAQFPGVPGLHFPGCAHQS